jgi:hypothetical protein
LIRIFYIITYGTNIYACKIQKGKFLAYRSKAINRDISKKVNLIEMALEYLIKYKKRLNLINMAGNIAFNVDLNATRGRK